MNFTNENKLEQLERKVQELERKLEQKTSKDDSVREVEARLAGYQDHVRSDKGEVILKKNFVIENRKALKDTTIEGKISPDTDNSATLYFNNVDRSRLNHLFLGYASAKGNYNTSVLSGAVVNKENIPRVKIDGENYPNPNNGIIQFKVFHQKYFDSNGLPIYTSPDGGQPNIVVGERGLFAGQEGVEGVVSQVVGTGKNPYASIGTFVEDNTTPSTFVACDKDNVYIYGIPTSDPGVAGAIWNSSGTLKISSG
jgi:hypothetical protein